MNSFPKEIETRRNRRRIFFWSRFRTNVYFENFI